MKLKSHEALYSPPASSNHFAYTDCGYLQSTGTESYEFDFSTPGIGVRTRAPGRQVHQDGLDPFGRVLSELSDNLPLETTYNPMGEVLTQGPRDFEWDPFDRLIKIRDPNFTWEAAYDALGRPLQTRYCPKQGSRLTTTSLYDPEEEFQEIGVKVEDKTFWKIYGPNSCDAVADETGASVILVQSALGHLTAIVSSPETLPLPQLPSPYGPQAPPPLPTDLLSYAHSLVWHSQSQDPTGLIRMGARTYDPKSGRFLSPDPVGYPLSLDLYSYANGDPINYFDPDGRFFSPVYQPIKPTVLQIGSAFSTVWHSPYFQGSAQAVLGLSEVTAGGAATFGTNGLAAPIGWPVMAHGFDQLFTGLGTALTGRPRETVTEHFLQKTGMPSEWASFTNSLMSAGFTMGSTAVFRSSQLMTFPKYSFPMNNALERGAGSIVGHNGWEIKHPPYQNTSRHTTTIQNRLYSGHALDQMQNRGFVPSVVENTINKGRIFPTKPETIGYYDSTNNVRVIVNSNSGKVVTVIPGAPK